MKRTKSKSAANGTQARVLRPLPFAPPPLLDGEDAKLYDELLEQITEAVIPADVLEQIWVRDVVDLSWEIFRLRGLKAALLSASGRSKLMQLLPRLVNAEENGAGSKAKDSLDSKVKELAHDWRRGEPRAVKKVQTLLAGANDSVDRIMARAMFENIDFVERIDYLTTMAVARRDKMLREIDRHRSTLSASLRKTVAQIEDGEYRVVAPSSTENIVDASQPENSRGD